MASMRPNLNTETYARMIRNGGYLNRTLMSICAAEGLKQMGVKLDLQQRIIDRLQSYADREDSQNFQRLAKIIESPHSIQPGITNSGMGSSAVNAANAFLNATNNSGGHNMGGGPNGHRALGVGARLEFKPSPFYSVEQQIGDTKACDVMQHHRHTVTVNVRVSEHPILARVVREPSLKVMVYCAGDIQGRQDIAFPHQSEVKVNTGEIKANLRGLKNKPGSTRPVDITKDLRLNIPTYSNAVELTYALTSKKFYFAVLVVKAIPVVELVQKLEIGKRITEQSVLDEMAIKAQDQDIVTTASVLSLKCPLSTLRIDLPIRGTSCRHNQCFDGTSYLQLQEQGPTWLCPICNNPAPFESLAVDEYVKDILKKTPKSADQVIVQPNGKWELNAKKENGNNSRSNRFTSESDEDLVEVTKTGNSVRTSTPQVLKPFAQGLGGFSRGASSSSLPSSGTTSAKRPIAAVIDLTSSGDEDEPQPARPVKRPFVPGGFGTPSSAPAFRPPPTNGFNSAPR